MNYKRLVPILAALLLFGLSMRVSIDTDTWWHLAAGRWMTENGALLDHDVFSHSVQGGQWTNPSWLSQLVLFRVYLLAGLGGLNLLTALLACSGLLLLWPVLEGPSLLKMGILILAAAAAAIFWAARPHMFSFAFSGAFVFILERWRLRRSPLLWLLPALMIPWANLHGGFAIGYILIGLYLLGGAWEESAKVDWKVSVQGGLGEILRALAPLLIVAAASLVAACLNPFGVGLLRYPLQTVSIGSLRLYIQEWQSPDFHQPQAQPFAWMLLALSACLALSQKRKQPTEMLGLAVLGYMSLLAARNIATFALVTAPTLTRHAAQVLRQLSWKPQSRPLPAAVTRIVNSALIVLVCLGVVLWSLPKLTTDFNDQELARRMPFQAVQALAESGVGGRLLNSYDSGGYLIWKLWPDYQTYVDGRTDIFGDRILGEYLNLWRAEPGWEAILAERDFQVAILEPTAPITLGLQSLGWHTLYRDSLAVVLAAPEEGGDR